MRVAAVTGDAADIAEDTNTYTPAVTAASRVIDTAAGRQFGAATIADRKYKPWYSTSAAAYFIDIDDMDNSTGMTATTASGTVVTTSVVLYPLNAAAKGRPWTMMKVTSAEVVTVHAIFGWTAVPATIVQATLLQASRLVKRRDAPFGVAGSPEMGSEIRLLAKLDPDVEVMIRPYRRYW
jgi:hypothetical protein